MVVQTPNANISLKNSDGEVGVAPAKSAGAVPTTVSLVNSGTMLVKGDVGAAVPVASNMAAAVAGSALPNVTSIAAAPMLTAMVQKTPLVALQPPSTTLPAIDPTGGKSGSGGLPAVTHPVAPAIVPAPIAIAPVIAPAPIVAPKPMISPVITPAPVSLAPVFAPAPIVAPKPVIAPVVAPLPVVIAPVIAPKPVLSPIRTCSTLLINGVKTTVCK
jgi:hypothetical protein